MSLYEEAVRLDLVNDSAAWHEFKKRAENDCLILLIPSEKKHTEAHHTDDGFLAHSHNFHLADNLFNIIIINSEHDENHHHDKFSIPEMIYSVILCKELGGYELGTL